LKIHARIKAVAKFLPDLELTNESLSLEFPEWNVEKIRQKTGIATRHIAGPNEYSSSMGFEAVKKLLLEFSLNPLEIDTLLVVTQTPDFMLPGIAPMIHDALEMRADTGAFDINVGCSGYVYGLGIAKGLIESDQAKNVVLVTSDSYSKLLNPADKSVRTIFGDGATATWISSDGAANSITGFTYGTDGSGAEHLLVPTGGLRNGEKLSPKSSALIRGFPPGPFDLFMNGPEIFKFTIRVVEQTLLEVLKKSKLSKDEVDFFVFHQANAFMLEHLVRKLDLPSEKAPILMKHWGNTVSGTIPMALTELTDSGRITAGTKLVLIGFGVGFSWAGASVVL
jgi:3-oxoacyl-[acyl-carrier-protein] synthase-3